MMNDRVIQFVSVGAAVALLGVGGSLLPRVVDSAGEPYLLFRVGEGAAAKTERVRFGELRTLATIAPGGGSPFEITFDGGSQKWEGPFGSTVKVGALINGDMQRFEGILEGSDGYGLRYTDVAV